MKTLASQLEELFGAPPPNPCVKGCPERSDICHGSCPKYQAYYDYNRLMDQARLREISSNGINRRQQAQAAERTKSRFQTRNHTK